MCRKQKIKKTKRYRQETKPKKGSSIRKKGHRNDSGKGEASGRG